MALLFLSQQQHVSSWKPADAQPPSYFYRIYDPIQLTLPEAWHVSTKHRALEQNPGSKEPQVPGRFWNESCTLVRKAFSLIKTSVKENVAALLSAQLLGVAAGWPWLRGPTKDPQHPHGWCKCHFPFSRVKVVVLRGWGWPWPLQASDCNPKGQPSGQPSASPAHRSSHCSGSCVALPARSQAQANEATLVRENYLLNEAGSDGKAVSIQKLKSCGRWKGMLKGRVEKS